MKERWPNLFHLACRHRHYSDEIAWFLFAKYMKGVNKKGGGGVVICYRLYIAISITNELFGISGRL
jgi:hypothetical protein